jgi:Tfp pilus assembly protein PilO
MELPKGKLKIVLLVVVAILIFNIFVSLPMYEKLKKQRLEMEDIQSQIREAKDTLAKLEAAEISYKMQIITEKNISAAIEELTKQGNRDGVDFVSIKPLPIENDGDSVYKIIPLHIEIESTYDKIGTFLGSLRNLKKSLVIVKSFDIKTKSNSPLNLKARMILNLYLAK